LSDETQIDEQIEGRRRLSGAVMTVADARVSKFLGWAWATIGALAVMVGIGVYTKLSELNDTLIGAVADIRYQAVQTSELKTEVRELRNAQIATQRQVDSLEGKTLRGIQEAGRGR
jgi:hypothetical protein